MGKVYANGVYWELRRIQYSKEWKRNGKESKSDWTKVDESGSDSREMTIYLRKGTKPFTCFFQATRFG